MRRDSGFTFGDLFAGAGLFSAGMVQMGFEPKFAIELSKEAAASYARNVAPVIHVGSVVDLRPVPDVDVLIAGPPCQGFSTLGRRDPSDERNELSLAILPWVAKLTPKIVLIENVPPFIRSPHWRNLAAALESVGFCIQTWDLEAADFGTPQHRRRAFTVASRVGALAEPQPFEYRLTAGDAILDAKRPIDHDDPMHTWPTPKGIAAQRIQLVPPKGDKRDILAIAPELCPPSWVRVGCNATDVWGRIDPGKPSNTVRCTFQNPSKGRYLHPTENRVLSLREGARLQGVPDSWRFEGRPTSVARQIGNGVPVPLAMAVANSVYEALASPVRLAA